MYIIHLEKHSHPMHAYVLKCSTIDIRPIVREYFEICLKIHYSSLACTIAHVYSIVIAAFFYYDNDINMKKYGEIIRNKHNFINNI